MLSEHEQRQLERIEDALAAEEPLLANMLKSMRLPFLRPRRLTPRPERHHTAHLVRPPRPVRPHHRKPNPWLAAPAWMRAGTIITAFLGTCLSMVIVLAGRNVNMEQFINWFIGYYLTFFFGIFAVIYTLYRTITNPSNEQRWVGFLRAFIFLVGTICILLLITKLP